MTHVDKRHIKIVRIFVILYIILNKNKKILDFKDVKTKEVHSEIKNSSQFKQFQFFTCTAKLVKIKHNTLKRQV